MSLAEKDWTRVSLHKVALTYLRAERAKVEAVCGNSKLPRGLWSEALSRILDKPNIDDPEENRTRLRLLYLIRNLFVLEIPPDTEWWEVCNLTDKDLEELHVVNHEGWNDPADRNELRKVAERKRIELSAEPSTWEPAILWGHNRRGPFTIIEGNNRLTAYVGSGRTGINTPVLVGLSPMRCIWHIFDRAEFLIQDLLRQ
jgi:hypothetical protein